MRRRQMQGRKAKAYHQCNQGTALKTFSCKNKKQKSTRLSKQGLIYKISFFFFISIFTILLTFQQAYIEFAEQLNKLNTKKSRTSGTPKQFHQKKKKQESKKNIQAADTQSSPNQKNIIPHRSAKQKTASHLPSQEPAQKQQQQQQQSQQGQQSQQDQQPNQQPNQQNQNKNILTRKTKPTAGQNRQTR